MSIKKLLAWVVWSVSPDGSVAFWAYRGGMWRNFVYTKKWWLNEKYYLNGSRVGFFAWWAMLIL